MRKLSILILCLAVSGCGGGVGSTVLQDFGIQDRPDDYVSGSEMVMKNMQTVGATELKRLNTEGRYGELVFDDSEALRGRYYKKVKKYIRAYPIEAKPVGRTANRQGSGFNGLIEYAYEIYEGPRFSNRTEANASDAEIPTGTRGRDTFRYRFSAAGNWDGNKGVAAGSR